jgi:SpoVK/Ycf46/Vps4 family AAA+-type ATPase
MSEDKMDSFFGGVRTMNKRYGFNPMIWCDDLESAFLEDLGKSSREVAVTQSTLLNNLQGVSKDHGIRISGSTNFPEKIDDRFLEFGRISYMFHIPLPKEPSVLKGILAAHIEDRKQVLSRDLDLMEVAGSCIGYTPRMLVNLVNEAGVQAARRIYGRFGEQESSVPLEVTMDDYMNADRFLRSRSDINLIQKRDEEIGEFIEKHNKRKPGF